MKAIFKSVLAGSVILGAAFAAHAADVEAGEKVFRKCKACHVLDSDKNRVGPTLQNLIGRTAGTVEGFKYSKAMVEAGENGLVWSEEILSEYLVKPREYVKGTKMAFAGLKKEEDIENVIAYIAQFSEASGDEETEETETTN